MSNDTSDNVYSLFGLFLDPAETDPQKLIQLLHSKMSEWKKKVNVDDKYNVFLAEVKLWLSALGEKTALDKKDEDRLSGMFSDKEYPLGRSALLKYAANARQIKLKELNMAIAEVERDGVLERQEYDYLIKEFCQKGFFTEETVQSLLSLPISETPPAEKKDIPKKPEPDVREISKAEMDKLDSYFKVYNKGVSDDGQAENIYDLLESVRGTSASDLLAKAKKFCEDNRNQAKKTVYVEAKTKILTKAITFFKNEETKLGYDRALERRRFDQLCDQKFVPRAKSSTISRDIYLLSIDEARECGLSQEWAEWYVYEFYCVKNKHEFPQTAAVPREEKVQCPNCFKLNSPDTVRCSCGTPLKVDCPKCHRSVAAADKVCSCGFAVGNMPNALLQIGKARKELASGKLDEALESLRQAEVWWPGNPDVDQLKQTIQKRVEEKEKHRRRVAEIETKIRDTIQKQRLYQARNQFAELRAVQPDSPFLAQEEKRVETILIAVGEKLKKLAVTTDVVQKTALCEEILSAASDCAEARAIMDKIPPMPPSDLKATVTVTGVELRWKPSSSRLKSGYLVVRKVGAAPSSPQDGELLIKQLNNTVYVDSSAKAGVIYGYAVFTQRESLAEPIGCRSGLAQRILDAERIRTLPGNKTLTLEWTAIPTASGAVITRWKDRVENGRGTLIRLLKKSSFVDPGLENDQRYAYRVQIMYKGIDGSERLSEGSVVTGVPRRPPKPVNNLRIQFEGDSAKLEWTPPEQGDFYIFTPEKSPEMFSGKADLLSLSDLTKQFGEPIPIPDPSSGSVEWKSVRMGTLYLLPVTLEAGIAVFGQYLSVSRIRDIDNLNIQFAESEFYLTWTWPQGIEQVLILWRRDRRPEGPNDKLAQKMILSQEEYAKQKSFARPIKYKNLHFAFYSVLPSEEIYSEGVFIFTGKTTIRYDMKVVGRSPKNASAVLSLHRESGEGHLPRIMILMESGRQPLNRNFGECLAVIEASEKDHLEISVPLKAEQFQNHCFIRLFTENVSEESFFNFNAPPPNALELVLPKGGLFSALLNIFKRKS